MNTSAPWRESRRHELAKTRLVMVDGHLAVHSRTREAGLSERVCTDGYWGYAAAPAGGDERATAARLADQALANARAMASFGPRAPIALPGGAARGEHRFRGRPELSSQDAIDRLAALHAHVRERHPQVVSSQFILFDEDHAKQLRTSGGSDVLNCIQRAALYVTLSLRGDDGAPVELMERVSAKGSIADLDLSVEALAPMLDAMHGHVQAKRHAVPARGGRQAIVLGPDLAGILAHEAMGHPCEADLVLGGAVTGDLLGQPIASELVTMVDYAHTVGGREALVPVYADDEGTPGTDAVLIDRGVLSGFMSSRETAARLGIAATGSARAYLPHDEPLVRMRNTGIVPGTSKLADMIAGVERGYLLLKTGNGQADSTTEFMFAISLGYEIENGKVGRAIRDTTVSGSAIDVLRAVDAVSDDDVWTSAGYCGKKQPMVVSMGGPALRTRAHLGGA